MQNYTQTELFQTHLNANLEADAIAILETYFEAKLKSDSFLGKASFRQILMQI